MIISITEASKNTSGIANGLSELKGPEVTTDPDFKNHLFKPFPQNIYHFKMLLSTLIKSFKLNEMRKKEHTEKCFVKP